MGALWSVLLGCGESGEKYERLVGGEDGLTHRGTFTVTGPGSPGLPAVIMTQAAGGIQSGDKEPASPLSLLEQSQKKHIPILKTFYC